MKTSASRQLRNYLLAFCGVIGLSTLCFMVTEQLNFSEALYFSIITMSSVGYGDILPQTPAGRILAMVFIVLGAITFLGIIAQATELMLNRRENETKRKKLHMLMGVFFDEIGRTLLEQLVHHLPQQDYDRRRFHFGTNWNDQMFRDLKGYTATLPLTLHHPEQLMAASYTLIPDSKPLLIRLLENPAILEHGDFSELLLALFHFEQELSYRNNFDQLPPADLHHLCGDAQRVYRLLLPQWLDYLQHLRQDYPYLYSLQVRVNPFKTAPSAIVDEQQ
ncbi:MAG: two pore domain potassium channel family protein [Desulfuromonas sp.]|nr:two pore domain potassium channel family protein [Desulfuromonas sp.]